MRWITLPSRGTGALKGIWGQIKNSPTNIQPQPFVPVKKKTIEIIHSQINGFETLLLDHFSNAVYNPFPQTVLVTYMRE